MDWASRLRSTLRPSPPPTHDDTGPNGSASPPSPLAPGIPTNKFTEGILRIAPELWLLVFEGLSDAEVLVLARTCVFMRRLMLVDRTWQQRLAGFEVEFEVSQKYSACAVPRDYTAAAACRFIPPAMEKRIGTIAGRKVAHYFASVHFHTRDAMRRWNLLENGRGNVWLRSVRIASRLLLASRSARSSPTGSSSPQQQTAAAENDEVGWSGNADWASSTAGPSSTTATSPLLLDALRVCMLDRGRHEFVRAASLLSFFDCLTAHAPCTMDLGLVDITESEDPVWLSRLLVALSPSHIRALHTILGRSPVLVEIFEREAHDLADYCGGTADLLQCVVAPQWTRFFSGPQLCSRGGIGLVLVDPMRCIVLQFADRRHL